MLAREGVGGASIARIAERIGADVAQAAGTAGDPSEVAAAWVDTVWSGLAARPEVPRAYFALVTSTWADAARDELQDLRRTYLAVVDRLVDSCERSGWRLRQDRETFARARQGVGGRRVRAGALTTTPSRGQTACLGDLQVQSCQHGETVCAHGVDGVAKVLLAVPVRREPHRPVRESPDHPMGTLDLVIALLVVRSLVPDPPANAYRRR